MNVFLLVAALLQAQDNETIVTSRTLLARLPKDLPDGPHEVSAEGRAAAFLEPPNRTRVEVNNKPGAAYTSIARLAVLADGRPLYAAGWGTKYVIVAGDKEGPGVREKGSELVRAL